MSPVSYTCKEAAQRHKGFAQRQITLMCTRGLYLTNKYGNPKRIPKEELATALLARKVGKSWSIPTEELDRVFLRPEFQRG